MKNWLLRVFSIVKDRFEPPIKRVYPKSFELVQQYGLIWTFCVKNDFFKIAEIETNHINSDSRMEQTISHTLRIIYPYFTSLLT